MKTLTQDNPNFSDQKTKVTPKNLVGLFSIFCERVLYLELDYFCAKLPIKRTNALSLQAITVERMNGCK